MQKDALYYPHIGLSDSAWTKAMALYYDNVYRIVPDNVIPEDSAGLEALLEEGSVGKRIDPLVYSQAASDEFLSKLDSWNAAALDIDTVEDEQFVRLHSDKIDHRVRQLFNESGYHNDNDWMHVPTEIASNYMLYLATAISKRNNLALLTPNWGAWTGTSYFNLNGQIDDFTSNDLDPEYVDDPFALFCLLVSEITPLNISSIPSDDVLKFRVERSDEISNFRNCINDLYTELQSVESNEIQIDIIEKKADELAKAKENYQKSADIIKAKGWFGTTMMGFPAPVVFGKMMSIPTASTVILGGTGLALGALFSIKNTKNEIKKLNKDNPISCLVEMNNSFKNYTSARGGGDMNYHAWNCMEEFIND